MAEIENYLLVDEEEESLRSSDIAITKLVTKTVQRGIINEKDEKFSEAVFKFLKERFGAEKNHTENGRSAKFIEPFETINGKDGNNFYLAHCVVTKIKNPEIRTEEDKDKNTGEIWFLYWGESVKDLNIYCFLRSKNTNAWNILTKYRDFDFPKTFARAFLDPKNIRKLRTSSLIGVDRGSQNKLYSKDHVFDPASVIERFDIIEEMKTPFDSHRDCSKKLMSDDFLNIDNPEKIYVEIQLGQIKLPMETSREFKPRQNDLEMMKFINETIQENKADFMNDPRWRFLDHCKLVNSKHFNEKLKYALLELYNNPEQKVDLIDLDSSLTYIHEDSFQSRKVNLFYKSKLCHWRTELTLAGLAITVKDVLDALHDQDLKLINLNDIDNITLSFYDNAKGKEVEEYLINMLMSVDLVKSGNQRHTQIKCGLLVYMVALDSYYEVFYRFVEAVKESLLEEDDGIKPEILQWNLKKADFTIDELYEFCKLKIKLEDSEEQKQSIENLKIILCEETSLFDQDSKGSNVMKDLVKNPDVSKSSEGSVLVNVGNNTIADTTSTDCTKTNSNQFTRHKHSSDLISLNRVVITKDETFVPKKEPNGEDKTKKSNDKKNNNKSDGNGTKNNGVEKSNGNSEKGKTIAIKDVLSLDNCNDTNKSMQKILLESKPTIKQFREGDYYQVENPYLTKSTWIKIEETYPEICPVKLIQFLRMKYGLLEEGDYNELYHLSNCECSRKINGGWFYVVGDRIETPTNHKIELCDVMAINEKKIFYLHVKHKFDAGAARNLCSQVKVGIKCIWETLMAYSNESNMVGKFYDVAMGKGSSVHEKLTRMEVSQIGNSKEKFLEVIADVSKQHYVCLAPFIESDVNKFKHLKSCNLIDPFCEDDFDQKEIFDDLQSKGVLNKNGRVKTLFFNFPTKTKFVEELMKFKEASIVKGKKTFYTNAYENAHDTIQRRIGGEYPDNSLISRKTFVSKFEFVELYNSFSKYKRVHGRIDPIKLKIIDIESQKSRTSKIEEKEKPIIKKKAKMNNIKDYFKPVK